MNETITMRQSSGLASSLGMLGGLILRYGLAVILLSVGALKFTAYEADGIEALVANSPLMAWAYQALGLRPLAMLIGVVEIGLGLLIAVRPLAPRASAVGSLGATGMFLITLSFLLTTPGVWQPGYGFPFPSPMPGQFLLKDVLLLGAALWTAGEALSAARRPASEAAHPQLRAPITGPARCPGSSPEGPLRDRARDGRQGRSRPSDAGGDAQPRSGLGSGARGTAPQRGNTQSRPAFPPCVPL